MNLSTSTKGMPLSSTYQHTISNVQAFNFFMETMDSFVASIESYVEEKHFKSGIVWSGSAEYDSSVKLSMNIYGHQVGNFNFLF